MVEMISANRQVDSTVLLFMIDALRHDVLSFPEAEFMRSLAHDGIHGVAVPTFGFEPDAAYLAGLYPEQCDGGAQFWRRPGQRLFRMTKLFAHSERVLPGRSKRFARLGARAVAQWLSPKASLTRRMASSASIPWPLLDQFSTPMTRMQEAPGFTPTPTVFDMLRKHGAKYHLHSAPAYRVKVETVVDRYLSEEAGDNSFAFLFIGDLDGVGHTHGPGSKPWRKVLKQIDDGVRQIVSRAREKYARTYAVIFGDHGMVETKRGLDLSDLIKRAYQADIIESHFLDSTMARFWLRPGVGAEHLEQMLASVPDGHVLTKAECAEYRIRYPHNYFGDVIFAVDDGIVVHPSFYSDDEEPPKGMHGYLPGCANNESALVISGPGIAGGQSIGRIDMRRIFPTLLDLLAIPDDGIVASGLTSVLSRTV